jgi:uncharacterized protein (DUF1778 family)
MATVTTKQENIHFRISSEAKSVIDKAVIVSGQSLTDFATRSLLESAKNILEHEFTSVLSNRDRDRLLKILDDDIEPNEALRRASNIHKDLIIE